MTASFWTRINSNTDTFHAVSLIKIFLHLNNFFDCYRVKLQTNNFNLIFLSDLNHGTKLPMYFRWISAIFCCQTLLRQKYAGIMLTEYYLPNVTISNRTTPYAHLKYENSPKSLVWKNIKSSFWICLLD